MRVNLDQRLLLATRPLATRREKELQLKEKELQEAEKKLRDEIAELELSKQLNQESQQELEEIKRERNAINEELEKVRKIQKEDVQEQAKAEFRREKYSESIENALEHIQEPNKYIFGETIVLNCLFGLYLALSATSVGFLVYFVYETHNNPLSFSGIAPKFGIYVYLNYIAPKVISLVLFSTFLALANRSRRSIQGLQERKRSVEQLRGALLAINELSDTSEVALRRIDKIMESLSNRALLDFTEGSSAHGNPDAHDKEDNVIPLDKLKGFLVR